MNNSSKEFPLVKALMITGKDDEHLELSKQSVKSFLRQDYPNKKLIIINDGNYSLLDYFDDESIEEFKIEKSDKVNLGKLRNISLSKVNKGEYWVQWDDDDWHHEEFIKIMIREMSRSNCDAMVLNSQLRHSINFNSSIPYKTDELYGIVGTIASKKLPVRYPSKEKGEDGDFIRVMVDVGYNVAILDNSKFPEFYIRLFHGNNTWNELDRFFGSETPKENFFKDESSYPNSKKYLENIMSEYYNFKKS